MNPVINEIKLNIRSSYLDRSDVLNIFGNDLNLIRGLLREFKEDSICNELLNNINYYRNFYTGVYPPLHTDIFYTTLIKFINYSKYSTFNIIKDILHQKFTIPKNFNLVMDFILINSNTVLTNPNYKPPFVFVNIYKNGLKESPYLNYYNTEIMIHGKYSFKIDLFNTSIYEEINLNNYPNKIETDKILILREFNDRNKSLVKYKFYKIIDYKKFLNSMDSITYNRYTIKNRPSVYNTPMHYLK